MTDTQRQDDWDSDENHQQNLDQQQQEAEMLATKETKEKNRRMFDALSDCD